MKKILNIMMVMVTVLTIAACGNDNHKQTGSTPSPVDNRGLIDCQNQNAALSAQLDQYRKADSIRVTEAVLAAEVEDTLSRMNLFPLGIVPIWDGSKIINVSKTMRSDNTLDGGFRWTILDLFKESGYLFLRKTFISTPTVWQKVFLSEQAHIGWLKKKIDLPSVNVDILPYLKDEYSTEGFHKEYVPSFKKFYAIHSSSPTEGVWYHPKWQEFEDAFFKSFPNAFGGDHSKFGWEYKLWLTAYKIPVPARKTLVSIIEQYNAL